MLKKLIISFTQIFVISFSVPAFAEPEEQKYNPLFALMDVVILRPLGLCATILGSALFVGLSPVTALAQITPPHDAFDQMGHILVMTPVDFTFSRPIGVNEPVKLSVPPHKTVYHDEHRY